MSQTVREVGDIYRVVHTLSTHAPLNERYMNGEYQPIGEAGEDARIDPKTGAEYRALGGREHRYSKDFRVGGSYGKTMFVYGADSEGNSVDHDALEAALRENGLWTDAFTPVIVPKGTEHRRSTWWYAFQIRPPERAPSTLSRIESKNQRAVGEDAVERIGGAVETYLD